MVADVFSPVGLLGTFFGVRAANKQNEQIKEQNRLLAEQYADEKAIRLPGVSSAQQALQGGYFVDKDGSIVNKNEEGKWVDAEGNVVSEDANYGQWVSQFDPYINAGADLSSAGINTAKDVYRQIPDYLKAGRRGVAGFTELADLTPEKQAELADYYTNRYAVGQRELDIEDANRAAGSGQAANRVNQGRFGALGSQKARADAYVGQARDRAIADAYERARKTGYDYAQGELTRRFNTSNALTGLGTTGVNYGVTASNLGQGNVDQALNLPFKPSLYYGQAVGAQPSVTVPQYGRTIDTGAVGAGNYLQWSGYGSK